MIRFLVVAVCCATSGIAFAQSWPEKGPVSIISSNSPASTPDFIARMVADGLTLATKQRFVVENRPGGNSIIATMQAVRAKPDGYTLYLSGNSALAANPHLLKSLPYDPEKDLTPITTVVNSAPMLIVVHPSMPVKNIGELVKLAREQPGQITYASSGTLAPFLGEMLNKTAGIRMRQVRYKETASSVQDTVAGRTNVNFLGKTLSLPLIQENKLRVLAIAGRERFSLMPEVPALEEDYPGVAVEGWFVLMGPAGLPDDIGARIRKALDPYLKSAETVKRLTDLGLTTRGAVSPQETRNHIHSESERWARIVKELGVKPQ